MGTKGYSGGSELGKSKGFTLVEILIVIGIILVIAAFAMPNLLRSRINANETAALSALRLISSSEIGFKVAKFRDDNKDGEGDYGTIEELDEHLATGTKHGYSFNVIVTPGSEAFPSAYSCRAIPLERGKTGVKSFYVDQTNVVRYSMDAAGPGPDSPILP